MKVNTEPRCNVDLSDVILPWYGLEKKKQFKDYVDVQGLKKVKIYISNLLGFKSSRNEYRRGS